MKVGISAFLISQSKPVENSVAIRITAMRKMAGYQKIQNENSSIDINMVEERKLFLNLLFVFQRCIGVSKV